ncbi:MAG TPA: 6-phosphogluconolactonase [Cryptosporangiaceae bacterium]|nr:6-phosphogluconolactonase [Cryptosporangiaceae bacterium]
MSNVEVVVHRDREVLAAAAAARLLIRLVDAQHARGSAAVVLTGGGVGTAMLAALAAGPARDAVDWRAVDVWWGDERFLPGGHPDRNETQARAALLDAVPTDPKRVHPMPASDGPAGNDPEAAAEWYADELARLARPGHDLPHLDVLLLGVGPDGHVASIFPESPAVYEQERAVVAVRGAPKPPRVRISLTFPAISSADEVWLVAAGEDKAAVIGLALSGAGPAQIPAAGVAGRARTMWLLDRAAAAEVPEGMRSLRG